MKVKRDARNLKLKAIASLKRGLSAFNSCDDDGRVTAVLLHLQHASEMLLKAALSQVGSCELFEKSGYAISMEKCINHSAQHLRSSDEERGVFRSIDALRDAEQHWYAKVDEETLYLEVQGVATAFDDVLYRTFGERLGDVLPQRVMSVSTQPPPRDLATFFDSQFSQIHGLLRPGLRQRDEALGRIRTLLAMENHGADNGAITQRVVLKAEKAIKAGEDWQRVFPVLATLATAVSGEGPTLRVRFSKSQGPPVRIVKAGQEPAGTVSAITEYNIWERYEFTVAKLAKLLSIGPNYVKALSKHLGLKSDEKMYHQEKRHGIVLYGYSHAALKAMRDTLAIGIDLKQVYRETMTGKRKPKTTGNGSAVISAMTRMPPRPPQVLAPPPPRPQRSPAAR